MVITTLGVPFGTPFFFVLSSNCNIKMQQCTMLDKLIYALKHFSHSLFSGKVDGVSRWERNSLPPHVRDSARIANEVLDKDLIDLVSTLSTKAGRKDPPKIIIYRDDMMNAYWQNNRDNGVIFIPTASLEKLSKDELKVLLAHEIVHGFQKHVEASVPLIATITPIAAALSATLIAYKKVATEKLNFLDAVKGFIIFDVAYEFTQAVVRICTRKIARDREYDADRGALLITKDLESVKSKFQKYEQNKNQLNAERAKPIPPTSPVESTTPLKAETPKAPESEPTGLKKILKDLYATHPTHEQRIAHLEKVKKQIDAGELKDAPLSRYF